MIGSRLLAYPYQFVRTPLAVLDMTVVNRLPPGSLLRRGFDQSFGMLDSAAGRLFDDRTLTRQGAERLRRDAPPSRASEPEQPRPAQVRPAVNKQRAAARKAAEHDDARPNQSLKTIRRRLVQTEAVTEARDRQDAEQQTEPTGD